MASREREQFDRFLLEMARKHAGGLPEFIGTLAGFLRRKTDFFTGVSQDVWEDLLLTVFRQECGKALETKLQEELRAHNDTPCPEKMHKEDKPIHIEDEQAQGVKMAPKKHKNLVIDDDSLSQPITVVDDEADKDDIGRLMPNKGGGSNLPHYKWTQTLQDVEIVVPINVDFKLRSSNVNVKFSTKSIEIGLKNVKPIVEGRLYASVKVDDCFWTLELPNKLLLTLSKIKNEFWPSVLVGETEISLSNLEPEPSKLSDLEGSTRRTVEKMMYEQSQKAKGLPTGDRKQKEALEKFMALHPEMDFSKCKI